MRQPWYEAYKEGCPTCADPTDTAVPSIHHALSMLFHGIQAAGPRLSAQAIDRGLHSIPARRSDDPTRPAAYFGPDNYTYTKDAAAMWWDPDGSAPGEAAPGCYRLALGGLRARAGDWESGDGDLRVADQPCQGAAARS